MIEITVDPYFDKKGFCNFIDGKVHTFCLFKADKKFSPILIKYVGIQNLGNIISFTGVKDLQLNSLFINLIEADYKLNSITLIINKNYLK